MFMKELNTLTTNHARHYASKTRRAIKNTKIPKPTSMTTPLCTRHDYRKHLRSSSNKPSLHDNHVLKRTGCPFSNKHTQVLEMKAYMGTVATNCLLISTKDMKAYPIYMTKHRKFDNAIIYH